MHTKSSKIVVFIVGVVFIALLLVAWYMSQMMVVPKQNGQQVQDGKVIQNIPVEIAGSPTPTLIPGL